MRGLMAIPEQQSKYKIHDIVDQLPKGKGYPWATRKPEQIDCIVIHHMASEAPLINQANFHINGRGWKAIGYHVVIDTDRILQTNDLLHRTNHCSGYNDRSIGIAIRGDLSKRSITPLERELLYAAILAVKQHFPNAEVKGHNECGVATSCPVISMHKVREDVMTMEQEVQHAESPQKKEEIAYRMANHILYLQNMSRGKTSNGAPANDGQKSWALNQLLKLQPEFERLGFLK